MFIRNDKFEQISRHCITILLVLILVVSMLVSVNFIDEAEAHIDEGTGDPLQLYSYFDPDANTAISLDGAIARAGSPTDEWDGGYARVITITNGSNTRFCYLLFANDDNYLYIGVIYDSPNAASSNGVEFYFDEGNEPGRYDGSHNDFLDPDKENYIEIRGNQPANKDYHDGYYDDILGWTRDDPSDTQAQEAWDDFDFSIDKGGNYFNWELKIPLDPKEDTAGGPSDLNVVGTDELGFYFRIWDAGDNTWYYWDLTGPDPGNVSVYADLRLGIDIKKDLTIYATYANTGLPTIDGDLSGDFAWANAYEREMILTNFRGEVIRSKLYACEDPALGYIFIGMVIYDKDTTSGDYLRLYFEEGNGVGPFGPRNGILSTFNEEEHYQEIHADGTAIDGHFNPTDPGTWEEDSLAGGENNDGDSSVLYKNEVGALNDRYEFEFLIPYDPILTGGSWPLVDGTEDLWINSTELIGFLIRYHDESEAVGEQDFWWDFTTNLDKVQTQETAGNVFSAIGWAYLQTGGPALKPITPIGGATVFGTDYIFRVEGEDEDGYDGVNFVGFQVEGQTSWISLVRESSENGIWYTYWDTTAYPDGTYNITIVAQDNEGIAVKKIIRVTIANGGAAVAPPSIVLKEPTKGSSIKGAVDFNATTGGIVSLVEFYVDNELTATMSNIGGDTWQYSLDTTYWNDATHVIIVIAKNAAGEAADAGTYIFDNWDLNFLNITEPTYDSTVNGTINVTGDFEADNSGDYAELYVDDNFLASTDTPTDLGGGDMAFQFSLDTVMLEEGSHQIKMFVYDPDGNKMVDTEMVVVDNTQPDTPTIISVLNDQYIEGVFTFQVYHDGEDLDSIEITITTVVTDQPMGFNSASGYYEYTLDTSAVGDGDYTITINATDAAGNIVASTSVNFHVDNNAPVLTITSPMDNSAVSGDVTFAYSVTEPFLESISYKVDGNSWLPIGIWNTTRYNDGPHIVKIRARDYSGHETIETLTLIVDNSNPTVNINNPMDGQFIDGVFTFKIMANDAVGIDEVKITVDYLDNFTTIINDVVIGYNSGTGCYEYILDTTILKDGNYSINATSYDTSQLSSGVDTAAFQIDNTPPAITIISPKNYAYVSDSVLFNVTVVDTFHKETLYNVDESGGWFNITTPLDTMAYEDGLHTIQIKAKDLFNHVTEVQIMLTFDNEAPSIVINSPLEEQFFEDVSTFQIKASDKVGVDKILITVNNTDAMITKIDGIPIGFNSATGYYEYTIDTSILTDGNYSLSSIAYDVSGKNSGIKTVNFNVDNNPPMLTIHSPLDSELVTGTVSIEAEAEDVFLSSIKWRVDGSGWIDIDTLWETDDFEDGTHTLEIKAIDEAGHVVSQTLEVVTDNNAPELYIVSMPNNEEHVGSSFFVQVQVIDMLEIKEVSYHFDNLTSARMFINEATGFYEANLVTDSSGHDLSDGLHDITITAIDSTGLSTSITRSVYVDNSGPSISNIKPKATVSGDVQFSVTVTDDTDVSQVYIRIDKSSWMEMKKDSGDTYTYTWNSRKVYNGRYDVDFKAVDTLGNEGKESTTVNVDNMPWLGIIIFLVGLVALLVLMAISRGKKAPKPKPPVVEEEPKEPEEPTEEEIPPPPEKATMVDLGEDEEAVEGEEEADEVEVEDEEDEGIPPETKSPVELYEDEMDKLAPPAPEEEY